MNDLTLTLARHIATTRFDDLSLSCVHASERSLVDAVGVMIGATGLGEGHQPFLETAVMQGTGPCRLLGAEERVGPLAAALANGALAHALDFEDALDGAPVHPNAALVPALMALADTGDYSGSELVTALAVGCDLVCRMGLALDKNPDDFGWYPPPILSTFGVTAAAANLMNLNVEQTAHALGLALAQATFSSEFKTYARSDLRAVRDGFPAQAGLLAAVLASKGTRAHLQAMEGKAGFFNLFARGAYSADKLVEGLGETWWGEALSFKAWPSCRGTHAFIQAALDIRETPDFDVGDIASIEAVGAELLTMLMEPAEQKRAPKTSIDAKFSIPYCVAMAFVSGEVTLASFGDEALQRGDVLAVTPKVQLRVDPAFTMADAARGSLLVRMSSGDVIERDVGFAKGAPNDPLSDDDLVAKFVSCAGVAAEPIEADEAGAIAKRLMAAHSTPLAADLFCGL